jgi:hypothetical protein
MSERLDEKEVLSGVSPQSICVVNMQYAFSRRHPRRHRWVHCKSAILFGQAELKPPSSMDTR